MNVPLFNCFCLRADLVINRTISSMRGVWMRMIFYAKETDKGSKKNRSGKTSRSCRHSNSFSK